MDTTWKVTEADRDEQGKIKTTFDNIQGFSDPRSLADLLPKPETIKQDARRQPWTRLDAATLAVVGLCAAFVIAYAWTTPRAPTASPQARATTMATVQPTSNTVLPVAAPIAAPTATPLATIVPTDEPAPVVAPVVEQPVAAPVPCTQDIAPFVVHRRVMLGDLPIGEVTGFSCTSAAEAEANADQHEAEVNASYAATTTTKTAEAR